MAKVGGAARPPRPAQRLVNSLADNCFAARRQQVEASQLFQSRDLAGHSDIILATEFSSDGDLLISGGWDKTVRLWSLNQGRDGENATVMEKKHERYISCLSFSPDSNRIFSGGYDSMIFIHDTQTLVVSQLGFPFHHEII